MCSSRKLLYACFFCSVATVFGVILCYPTEPPACGAIPSERQLAWLRMEWYAFVHFGINSFTGKEWGYGDESPSLFLPTSPDIDGAVHAFRDAGMTGVIYTAKHHDGFCLWPTQSTPYNITKSPWMNGKGDVVKLFSESCAKYGIKFGVYVSPWDRNNPEYGKEGYLLAYEKQITELLSHYGPIFEIWFDGANGGDGYYGGAREQRNISETYYNFPRLVTLIRNLQPECIIWGADGLGDVQWGGSEKGCVPYPCLNTVSSDTSHEKWMSLEADTTINREGWFWHPGQEHSVKSPAELMGIYLASVGRGGNLILNVALNREGKADPADLASLAAFGEMRRKLLAVDYALGAEAVSDSVRFNSVRFAASRATDGDPETYWCPADTQKGFSFLELRLPHLVTFDIVRLREQILLGQRVRAFRLEAFLDGNWRTIDDSGSSIGFQVMRQLPTPVTTDRVRLVITRTRACPCISEFSLLRSPAPVTYSAVAPSASPEFLSRARWKSSSPNAAAAWDACPESHWQSDFPELVVDLGASETFSGFAYLPRQDGELSSLTNRFRFDVSNDGVNWSTVSSGEFPNVQANPILQRVHFPCTVTARFIRFIASSSIQGSGASAAELYLILPVPSSVSINHPDPFVSP